MMIDKLNRKDFIPKHTKPTGVYVCSNCGEWNNGIYYHNYKYAFNYELCPLCYTKIKEN